MMMNGPELLCLGALAVFLAAYLWHFTRSVHRTSLATLIILPALYLSLETTSQFLTVDELYLIRETADLDFHYMNQWYCGGSLRTTDTFLGAFSRLARGTFHPTDTHLRMTLKLAHFAAGFLLLLLIHRLLWILLGRTGPRTSFSILFFTTTLLLPVSAVSLKVFNYDLLSMNLSVASLLLIAIAFRTKRSIYALLAIAAAYLAAQEKFSAGPVLLFGCAMFGLLHVALEGRLRPKRMILDDLRGIAAALATGLFCVVIVGMAGTGDFPRSFLVRIVDPLVAGMAAIILYPMGLFQTGEFSYARYGAMLVVAIVQTTASSLVLYGFFRLAVRLRAGLPVTARILSTVNLTLAFFTLAAGISATFLVRQRFSDFSPEAVYPFIHGNPVNGTIVFFGATSLPSHILASIGYAYAVFVNAVPTAVWCLLLLTVVLARRNPRAPKLPWYGELFMTSLLLVPLAWGAALLPMCNRYFNVYLLLFLIVITVKLWPSLALLGGKHRAIITGAVIILLAAEVLPFRPHFFAFRPFWSSFIDIRPQATLGNPVWTGWGEEVMLAGKRIEKMLRRNDPSLPNVNKPLTLYTLYAGDCLTIDEGLLSIRYLPPDSSLLKSDAALELQRKGKIAMRTKIVYDSTSLFLVNRSTFITDGIAFPQTARPVLTISFRGYPMAWVWRGDDLRDANYSF